MMRALMFLKGIPTLAWMLVGALAVGGAVVAGTVHAWNGHYRDGVHFGADSVHTQAELIVFQTAAQNAQLRAVIEQKQRTVDTVILTREARIAAGKIATDNVYADLHAQSDAALADSSAQRLARDAQHLAVVHDSLVQSIRLQDLAQDSLNAARDRLHASDSTMAFAQTVNMIAKDDTIATRTDERDARVTKTKVAVVGSVFVAAATLLSHLVWH